mgnify:CR=1 FL=1
MVSHISTMQRLPSSIVTHNMAALRNIKKVRLKKVDEISKSSHLTAFQKAFHTNGNSNVTTPARSPKISSNEKARSMK